MNRTALDSIVVTRFRRGSGGAWGILLMCASFVVVPVSTATAQDSVRARAEIESAARLEAGRPDRLRTADAQDSLRAMTEMEGAARLEAVRTDRLRSERLREAALRPQDVAPALPSAVRVREMPGTAAREYTAFVPVQAVDSSLARSIRTLPFSYEIGTPAGAVVLQAVSVHDRPLRFDPDRRRFDGRFWVGLMDPSHPAEIRRITPAVPVLITSEADTVDPKVLNIEQTNTLLDVSVLAGEARDSVVVRIVPSFELSGYPLSLPVEPYLRFSGLPTAIDGLGIGESTVTVQLVGRTLSEPLPVHLDADYGSVEPADLQIDSKGTASGQLRSAGLRPASLTASAPGVAPVTARIEYAWPWLFLAAGVLGGLAGAFLAGRWGEKQRSSLGLLVEGGIYGVLATTVFVALGINLIGLSIQRPLAEAAVFGFAALAVILRHVPDAFPALKASSPGG
jgi:hypothetical protein